VFLIRYEKGTLVLGFRPWDRMYILTLTRSLVTGWSFDP
jgi:hypothetical protein